MKVRLECVGGPLCGEDYEVEQNDYLHELPFGGMHRYCVVYLSRGKGVRLRRKQVLCHESLVDSLRTSRW